MVDINYPHLDRSSETQNEIKESNADNFSNNNIDGNGHQSIQGTGICGVIGDSSNFVKIDNAYFNSSCDLFGTTKNTLISSTISSLISEEKARRTLSEFILAGSFDDINENKIKAIQALLRKIAPDTELIIQKVEEGSIKITVEAKIETQKLLESLFKSGELTELLEFPITGICIFNKNMHGANDRRRFEIIRTFFDDKYKHLKKDKLSQAYLLTSITEDELQELSKELSKENIGGDELTLDHFKIMLQAYFMESSVTNKRFVLTGFVLTGLIAPILTGLTVLFFQQSVLESSGAIKPEDRTIVTECKRQLDSKGYVELEALCSPLKNKFFQAADTATYNAIGMIIHGDKWDLKKGYRGKDIANKAAMCPKLREIDKLWKDASGNKLGFNIQRKIWNRSKSYPAFTKDIGWKNDDGSWTVPSYDLEKVKDGHLPALWNQTHASPNVGDSSGEVDYKTFFEFIESCDLEN